MKRQSNIELLRIVLMLMIITHHVIVHGFGLKHIAEHKYRPDLFTKIELAINCFVVIAVNTFVFISGYFGLKFKLRTIVSFLLQAVFYSVTLFLIFSWINPVHWSLNGLIHSLFPISSGLWWFISTYFGLYFIAPFLNKGMETFDQKQSRTLVIGLIILNCFSGFIFGTLSENGYTIFNFIVIYLTARYLATYKIEVKYPSAKLVFSTLIFFGLCMTFLSFNKRFEIWYIFSYNNPLIIFSSIMLFFSFKNINIKSNKFINRIAGASLGIYMLHDYTLVRDQLTETVKRIQTNHGYLPLLLTILLIVSMYVSAASIEIVRKTAFERLFRKIKIE